MGICLKHFFMKSRMEDDFGFDGGDHVLCCQQFCGTSMVRVKNALDGVFGKDQVHITMVNSPEDVKPGGGTSTNGCKQTVKEDSCYWLQFFLFDCILERQLRPARDTVATDTPIKVQASFRRRHAT
jgi:hypothetical protein